MSTSSDSQWKTGLIIVAAILIVAAAFGGGLWALDLGVPYVEYVGGAIGAVIGFVAVSYLMYGR